MREVRLLATTQVRIFQPDCIPLAKVVAPRNGKKIQSLFNFAAIEPIERTEGVTGVAFGAGVYEPGGIVVESVLIEPRRISVKVQGSSEVAKAVFRAVSEELTQLNGGLSLDDLVCTHETGATVVLDFPFDRVFSDNFLSFIRSSAIDRTKNKWSENFVEPTNLKFAVRYKVTDDTLIKSSISLSSRELSIEPRAQSSLDDRLYWTTSPTDTDTHFELIKDLEKALRE